MKRTEKEASIKIPDWFRLFAATFCLAACVGGGRFVSTICDSPKDEKASKIPAEAPAVYLRSSHAFKDVAVFLDGRGRRFEDEAVVAESELLAASHTVDKEALEAPIKEDELLVQETREGAAEFVDEFEKDMIADGSSDLQDSFIESDDDARSFDELASSGLSSLGWEGDELDYDFEDSRATWAEIDKRKRDGSTLDGADFVDRFDESLVTDDLFRSEVRFEQTRASDGTGGITQVSGETPVRPRRVGRLISPGAVGGSGEVVIQIQ